MRLIISDQSNGEAGQNGEADQNKLFVDEIYKDVMDEIPEGLREQIYDIDSPVDVEIDIKNLIISFLTAVSSSTKSIPVLTAIADEINKEIRSQEPDKIICQELSPQYKAIVTDLANDHGIQIENGYKNNKFQKLRDEINVYGYAFFHTVFLFPFIFLRIIGRIKNTSAEVIFMPYRGRFDSMSPVIKKSSSDFALISKFPLYLYIKYWVKNSRKIRFDHVSNSKHKLKLFSRHVSFSAIIEGWRNVHTIFSCGLSEYYTKEIRNCTGLWLPNTVSYALGREVFYRKSDFLDNNFVQAILSYPIACNMIDETGCKTVVVGSGGKREKAIVDAANKKGITTFFIRHAMEHSGAHNNAIELTSGEHAIKMHKKYTFKAEDAEFVATGRPYLTELYKNHADHSPVSYKPDEKLRLLLLTTGHSDKIRNSFIKSVIKSARRSSVEFDIKIKIHPNESAKFYNDLLSDSSLADAGSIEVLTDNLFQNIKKSDIAVTTYSSSGLEAIVCGTPCISVQMWITGLPHFWTEMKSVPKFTSEQDLYQWFTHLTTEDIVELRKRQLNQIHDCFILKEDAAENINKIIDNSI